MLLLLNWRHQIVLKLDFLDRTAHGKKALSLLIKDRDLLCLKSLDPTVESSLNTTKLYRGRFDGSGLVKKFRVLVTSSKSSIDSSLVKKLYRNTPWTCSTEGRSKINALFDFLELAIS